MILFLFNNIAKKIRLLTVWLFYACLSTCSTLFTFFVRGKALILFLLFFSADRYTERSHYVNIPFNQSTLKVCKYKLAGAMLCFCYKHHNNPLKVISLTNNAICFFISFYCSNFVEKSLNMKSATLLFWPLDYHINILFHWIIIINKAKSLFQSLIITPIIMIKFRLL